MGLWQYRVPLFVFSFVAASGVAFQYRDLFVHNGAEERQLEAARRTAQFRKDFEDAMEKNKGK